MTLGIDRPTPSQRLNHHTRLGVIALMRLQLKVMGCARRLTPGVSMLRTAFFTFSLAVCSFVHAAVAEEDQPKSRLPSMTVTTTATREVVPDIAILRLSVSVESSTAAAAAEEMARRSQALLAEIRANGLDPRDLKTSTDVSPVFDEERGPQGQILKRTLRGYTARNAVTIRLHDTTRVGALARTLIDKGANVFESIRFEIGDDQRQMDELRVQATKDALRKAKLYADAAAARLGRVLTIEPDPDADLHMAFDMPRRPAPLPGSAATVVPVEPGVERLTAKVSVTFEILP